MTPLNRFASLINSISDPALRSSCETLLYDHKFLDYPAAIRHHHAYPQGLLAHTVEVASIAIGIASAVGKVNPDILITAALWHDWGKTLEYAREDGKWVRVTESNDHIQLGADRFAETYSRFYSDAIRHCILSHHGRLEWGSPEEPETREALILHQADVLSASYGATKDEPPKPHV